jgi:hypothetical protein
MLQKKSKTLTKEISPDVGHVWSISGAFAVLKVVTGQRREPLRIRHVGLQWPVFTFGNRLHLSDLGT